MTGELYDDPAKCVNGCSQVTEDEAKAAETKPAAVEVDKADRAEATKAAKTPANKARRTARNK